TAGSGGCGACGKCIRLGTGREGDEALVAPQLSEVGEHLRFLLRLIGPGVAKEFEIELFRTPGRHFGAYDAVAHQAAAQHADHADPARTVRPADTVGPLAAARDGCRDRRVTIL